MVIGLLWFFNLLFNYRYHDPKNIDYCIKIGKHNISHHSMGDFQIKAQHLQQSESFLEINMFTFVFIIL